MTALALVALVLIAIGAADITRGLRHGRTGAPMLLCGSICALLGLLFLIVAVLAALHPKGFP